MLAAFSYRIENVNILLIDMVNINWLEFITGGRDRKGQHQ